MSSIAICEVGGNGTTKKCWLNLRKEHLGKSKRLSVGRSHRAWLHMHDQKFRTTARHESRIRTCCAIPLLATLSNRCPIVLLTSCFDPFRLVWRASALTGLEGSLRNGARKMRFGPLERLEIVWIVSFGRMLSRVEKKYIDSSPTCV